MVLVILAILAAIMIPSLAGYIDKANQKRYIAEARSVYLAAQTILSEEYGLKGEFTTTDAEGKPVDGGTITYTKEAEGKIAYAADISALAEVTTKYTVAITYDISGKITEFKYTIDDKHHVIMNSSRTLEFSKVAESA